MSNYSKIKKFDVSNGDGCRTTIFFTGCDIHCEGCFNKDLQDPNFGTPFTDETYEEIKESTTPYIRGLSILGGEPFSIYNRSIVRSLCENFKRDFPDKTIYCWSGYTFEQLINMSAHDTNNDILKILSIIDILVDGPFIQSKYNRDLKMRGSSNQRIIYPKDEFDKYSLSYEEI